MADLLNVLPEVILYLASGFSFIIGLYLLLDKRFNFFSDISFTIMLVVGFLNVNIIKILPVLFTVENINIRNLIIVLFSLICGIVTAFFKNFFGEYISRVIVKCGRRKTSSESFWYNILDEKDKPIWMRFINNEKGYVLEGVLLSLDENIENPNILLGYCKKYNLAMKIIEDQYSSEANIQMIISPDKFDEIVLIYDKGSSKIIKLNVK